MVTVRIDPRVIFFFSSRRRHTSWPRDWSSDVCSSDLAAAAGGAADDRRSSPGQRGCHPDRLGDDARLDPLHEEIAMSARPSSLLIALLALPLPAALAAQTGQFLVRLGRDTLAVERYARTADRLEGEQVVRSPLTVHRLYTATFGPGGVVERFELITHNVSGSSGPLERRATASFSGDTAVMTVPRGESTATMRVKTGPGALPYVGQAYALVEEVTRRARVAG